MMDFLSLINQNDIYSHSLLVLLLGFFLLFIKKYLIRILSGISSKTQTQIDDVILFSLDRPITFLIFLLIFIHLLEPINYQYQIIEHYDANSFIYSLVIISLAWSIIRFLNEYYRKELFLSSVTDNEDKANLSQTYEIFIRIIKVIVFIITSLILMQEFGLSVSGLLAFGGVGGLVVGLAAKDLLSNLFGGLMIYFDRPFREGEFIKSPDRNIEGIVESIGWRLTVVRTFSKNVLYIPNSVFTNIVVENATRMTNRRINEVIGIKYSDFSNMPKIVDAVRELLNLHQDIDHSIEPVVYFNRFESSSCDFIVYAFTNTKEWREFLRVKEDILYKISEIIDKNGSSIAFPTTTIDLDQKP
jgi:MscS family membrane protein